jgi:hypothetical protein
LFVRLSDRAIADIAPALEHHHAIADLEYIVQPVRNDRLRDPVDFSIPQLANERDDAGAAEGVQFCARLKLFNRIVAFFCNAATPRGTEVRNAPKPSVPLHTSVMYYG